MDSKQENTFLWTTVSFLFGAILSLVVYVYTVDKDQVSGDIEKTQEKTNKLKDETSVAHVALMEKMYNLIIISNEKISDLKESNAKTLGQYELLNSKVDNMIKESEKNRDLYMSKFDAHDKRLTILEEHDAMYAKALAEYKDNIKNSSKEAGFFTGLKY